jgi:hypothetical protein
MIPIINKIFYNFANILNVIGIRHSAALPKLDPKAVLQRLPTTLNLNNKPALKSRISPQDNIK